VKQLRILHLIATLGTGGAEQNLLRLIRSMDRSQFVNEVVCLTGPGPVAGKIEDLGVPVYFLKMRKGLPDLRGVLKLRFMANLYRPHIVQCWMYHANLMGLTLLRPAATVWNIRCSDMDLSQYGGVYRLTARAGAKLSRIPAAVVVNSDAGRRVHTTMGYHPKKWAMIPNGFDADTFRPDTDVRRRIRHELDIPPDGFVIGLIGRFDPMKGLPTFFEAADLFLRSYPETFFILAGRGISPGNPDIRKWLDPIPRKENFRLLDERDDVPQILAALDTATSSSLSEGFPNAVGEAMACGLPCVATDAGDTGQLLGGTGILVHRGSGRELCAGWNRIARLSSDERMEMGRKARRRIIGNYSQDRATREYEALYHEILGET